MNLPILPKEIWRLIYRYIWENSIKNVHIELKNAFDWDDGNGTSFCKNCGVSLFCWRNTDSEGPKVGPLVANNSVANSQQSDKRCHVHHTLLFQGTPIYIY